MSDQLGNNRTPETQEARPRNLAERVRSLKLSGNGGPAPRGSRLPWVLCGILLLTTLAFAVIAFRGPQRPDAAPPPADAGDVAASGDVVLESKGYIIPAHQIQISPQAGGEIIWLDPNFKEGAVYKKGDKLAEIDSVLADAQLKNARGNLKVAETTVIQVETGSLVKDLEVARAQLKNLEAKLKLAQVDERYTQAATFGVSSQEKAKAAAQAKVDEAAYEVQKRTVAKLEAALEEQRAIAKGQLQVAQAAVEQAEKQVKNCIITAPTTGTVLSKKAELGGYVDPRAFGAAGYLCEMADLSDLEVDLSIQERDISNVVVGQKCRIMPEAFQSVESFLKKHPRGYDGEVSRLMPIADRAKGAISVRVKVAVPREEEGVYLKPDMSVIVSFLKLAPASGRE